MSKMVFLRFRKIFSAAFAALLLHSFSAYAEKSLPETDVEIWNRGVDLYKSGNLTNALAVLKPLVLSKTHGVRASELVGAIEFAEGLKQNGEGAEKALSLLESAANGFQQALRSSPGDKRMNRNFTRATDRLPELRERSRIEKVMKELGQKDPSSLLAAGVKDARSLLKGFSSVFTNEASRTVAMCDEMSERAKKLSDVWIAVKAGVAQSVTNEQQAMTINAQVEEARAATDLAATGISDISMEAVDHLRKAENSFTRFWKLAIMPPEACEESMQSQTNELLKAENEYSRDWQREALEFTQAFRAKFPMWAQSYEQQAQADTNKPPFTKEAQAEISALATEVEKIQLELADGKTKSVKVERKGGGKAAERAVKQFEALKKLARIKELLPKDKNGGGQNQDNQNQNQDQNQNQNQDRQNDQDNKENQDDRQNQDRQENKNENQEEQNKQDSRADEKKDDKQVEDILRRAQERSDQHEADKKARMNKAPLPSNERDW